MRKLLLASFVALAVSAPSAMADGLNINVGSGGISINSGSSSGNNNQMVNGLPACNMDSFVYQAAGSADMIYGDEGVDDIPPYNEFTKDHRIAAGITGQRAAGLTTGHGSYLPDAWGGDEWVKGPEFDQSSSATSTSSLFNLNLGNGTNLSIGANGGSLTSGTSSLNLNANTGAVNGTINGLSTTVGGSSGF